jgi:hypothetical protein
MTAQTRLSGVRSARNLILISLVAGVPRIVGALFFQREPFGDAYCYIEQVTSMRGKIVARVFAVENLYGFWLPLYQFFCAIVSLVVNKPVYVTRLVAALAGAAVCVLVYLCSYILTSSSRVSLLAFLAIAFNPFHLEYSSSAMTDVPHALLVIGCMYFVLTKRWTLAAVLGAAACLIRLESWMLIVLVPAIQFILRRKVPILTTLILASGPGLWLLICWRATGSPFASFQAHNQYMIARLTAHPEFNQLTLDRIWIDGNRLAYSMNMAVLAGCLAGLWLLWREWRKQPKWTTPGESSNAQDLFVCLSFFFAYLSFILFAYLTKNNTDIWPRYGLVLLTLGLPILAYSARQFWRERYALAAAVLGAAMVVGIFQVKTQTEDLARFLSQQDRSEEIANYLRKEYALDPSIKIFCDSPEVRIVSGIPGDHFYHSFFDGIPKDRDGFVGFLRTKGIKFLMIPEEDETSTPSQLFPPGQARDTGVFEDVIPPPDGRRADSLYRVRDVKSPAG